MDQESIIKNLNSLRTELDEELTGNILPWWIAYSTDRENGGFYGHIGQDNLPRQGAPKGAVLNARILYTFSAAYKMLGDSDLLDLATRAFRYIREHFLDSEFGGVYWELDHLGQPSNSRKQIYALAFTIYGMVEYHIASGDPQSLEIAMELFGLIEKKSRDLERNGYIEALSRDWQELDDLRLSDKDANESKTMNTHLHILEAYASLYRIRPEPEIREALQNVIRLFLERFINPSGYYLNLFFDNDWNLKSSHHSFGHDIECSWLLCEAAEILGIPDLVDTVREVSVEMAKANLKGLDRDFGLMNEFFPSGDTFDREKHWWQQAEAVVGYFNAWELGCDPDFLEKALKVWGFIREKIIDHEKGEWFRKIASDGKTDPADEKAGFWKCPYHNSRTCIELIHRISRILGTDPLAECP